jgi:hypothetical protein
MSFRRWIPPLAVALLAIGLAAWGAVSLSAKTEPSSWRPTHTPALDWNDDGAFVVDPSGAPVVGAHVVARPKTAFMGSHVSLRTDERGHFHLLPAVYDIWIGVDLPSDLSKPPRLFTRLVDVAPPFHGQRIVAAPPRPHRVPVRFGDGSAAPNVEIRWFNRTDVNFIDRLDLGPVWGNRETDERGDLVVWAAPGAVLQWERLELDPTRKVMSIACPGAVVTEEFDTKLVNSGSLDLDARSPVIVIDR